MLTVLVLVGAIVAALLVLRDGGEKKQAAPDPTSAPSLARFHAQDLEWEKCKKKARCTRVEVPIEYEKPDGKTLELAVKVVPAKGKGGRSLFINPGGPGAGSHDYADDMSDLLGKKVVRRYDIVAVDPRGVGASTPVNCVSDAKLDAFFARDPSPDDDAEVARFRKLAVDLGEGCRKAPDGLAAHLSTEEAARDLDIVREVLGAKTLDWFGSSYGTQLGATYATLFPERVGRMVLDGAVDPSLSYDELIRGQSKGFDRAFRAYVRECLGQVDCPLDGGVDVALGQLADLLESIDARPLKTNDKRELTQGLAYLGMTFPLYSESLWPALTEALKAAFAGDGSILLLLFDAYSEREKNGYSGNFLEMYHAVSCLDREERGSFAEVETQVKRFEKVNSVSGRSDAWAALVCADWPIPATHPQVKVDARGSEPIVVIGTTRDPATPYKWSKALVDQLGTGVLVTREGDGHTAYASGNSCIDDIVHAYLSEGTVPKDGVTCKE
jgi:pimeloyl-ACP methyl ester carboxylesterase